MKSQTDKQIELSNVLSKDLLDERITNQIESQFKIIKEYPLNPPFSYAKILFDEKNQNIVTPLTFFFVYFFNYFFRPYCFRQKLSIVCFECVYVCFIIVTQKKDDLIKVILKNSSVSKV